MEQQHRSLPTTTVTSKEPNDESKAAEVFLGGSCNPTTWRADVAMPELKKAGISFFNPVSITFVHLKILQIKETKQLVIICDDGQLAV